MKDTSLALTPLLLLLAACATDTAYDPLDDYVEVRPVTLLDAPNANSAGIDPENEGVVSHGKYLVELLGCGSCHTHGALVGVPDPERLLAGSGIGIAYTNPLEHRNPGVVFPPNITPDPDTGIGEWSDQQLIDAIRGGQGRHGGRLSPVMPWRGYQSINDSDIHAIASYLKSIEPVTHLVPNEIKPGSRGREEFVYFGVYESR